MAEETFQKLLEEYEALQDRGMSVAAIEFCYKIAASDEIALHFELIRADNQKPREKRIHLRAHFDKHGRPGMLYLSQFLGSADDGLATDAAYLMAESLHIEPRRLRVDADNTFLPDVLNALRRLTSSLLPECRRRAIIALAWLADESDIDLFISHLKTDADELCRAWSAAAFLQMSFHISKNILQKRASPALLSCLENETALFVLGCAVKSIEEIYEKRLGLSGAAVERKDAAAIDKGRKRAARFLGKMGVECSETAH